VPIRLPADCMGPPPPPLMAVSDTFPRAHTTKAIWRGVPTTGSIHIDAVSPDIGLWYGSFPLFLKAQEFVFIYWVQRQ